MIADATNNGPATTLDWFNMPQTELRSRIRHMLNEGDIKLWNIDERAFRQLVNGTPYDGVSLTTDTLRRIGSSREFNLSEYQSSKVAPVQRDPVQREAAPAAQPDPSILDSDPLLHSRSTDSVSAEDAEINRQLTELQERIKARSSRPAVDDNHITNIAGDTMRAMFDELFNQAVKNKPVEFTDAVGQAVAKFQSADMQAAVSGFVQSEFGQSLVSQVQAGDKTLLPPIKPVSSSFCVNKTTKKIEQMILSRFHIIISGQSGCGKTYPVEQVLNKLGRRWLKISCADGISMSELLAEKTIEVEQGSPVMKVVLKAIPVCVREGIVLIMDEGDQLAGEILSLLNPVTDSFPATLTVPQTGERIVAHKDFQMIMTCNGLTDETGLYAGHQISGALKTRVRFIHAPYLSKTEEVKILVADGLLPYQASELVDVFKKLRSALDKGVLTMPPSTRTMLSISKAMQGKDAYGDRVQSLCLFDMQEALEDHEYGEVEVADGDGARLEVPIGTW